MTENIEDLYSIVTSEYTSFFNWAMNTKYYKRLEQKSAYITKLFGIIKNSGLSAENNINITLEHENYMKLLEEYREEAKKHFIKLNKIYPNLVELFIDNEHKLFPINTVKDVVATYVNYMSGGITQDEVASIAASNMNKFVSGVSKEKLMENMF